MTKTKKVEKLDNIMNKNRENYQGYVYLIPFLMTFIGMFLYNRFPLSDSFWMYASQIISFYFVSMGTIMLMSYILRRKREDENK